MNPDGNGIFLDSDQRQRKTANPTVSDDDGDGLFDEDVQLEGGLRRDAQQRAHQRNLRLAGLRRDPVAGDGEAVESAGWREGIDRRGQFQHDPALIGAEKAQAGALRRGRAGLGLAGESGQQWFGKAHHKRGERHYNKD